MRQITLGLPLRYRLDLRIVKGREAERGEAPLFPRMSYFSKIKQGSRLKRYLRHVFEHKNVKRFLGSNLAIVALVATMLPAQPVLSSNTAEAQDVVFAQNEPSLKTETYIRFPVLTKKINQSFSFFHPGVDLDGETGDPIYPVMVGRVKAVQYSNYAYGNAIIVSHQDGFESLYAHLSKIEVVEGDHVTLNTKIGEMGSTGRSTGSHLHLEIHEKGRIVNPLTILPKH